MEVQTKLQNTLDIKLTPLSDEPKSLNIVKVNFGSHMTGMIH